MARGPGSERRYPRTARVNEVVREIVADELERLSDPRLGMVTVTGVTVSPDLRNATVYYSAIDPGRGVGASPGSGVEGTAEALRSAEPHLRAAIGRQVRMKYVPRLRFVVDPAVVAGARIERILRDLHGEGGT